MNKYYLGIDIAKDKFDVALLVEEKFKAKVFSNTNKGFICLLEWINKHNCNVKNLHSCMEATGIYGQELATFLHQHDYPISVVNPARIKGFGRSEMLRTKTDKTDSKLIARFCKAMGPDLWQPEPREIQLLQGLVRRLDALIAIKTEETNRLAVTIEEPIKNSVCAVIDIIEDQIADIKEKIEVCITSNPTLAKKRELLITIPGIGKATISVVLAFLVGPEKFESAKQMAAFVGLTPKLHESGSSVRGKSKISKVGNSQLRKAFYFPAKINTTVPLEFLSYYIK